MNFLGKLVFNSCICITYSEFLISNYELALCKLKSQQQVHPFKDLKDMQQI